MSEVTRYWVRESYWIVGKYLTPENRKNRIEFVMASDYDALRTRCEELEQRCTSMAIDCRNVEKQGQKTPQKDDELRLACEEFCSEYQWRTDEFLEHLVRFARAQQAVGVWPRLIP